MSKMRFEKIKLTEVIKKNRDGHRAEFEEALAGYEEKAIEQLSDCLTAIKAGKRPRVYIHLTMPEDHTKDYDRVLSMLSLTINAEIELADDEYAQYIQDDWGWKQQFMATNAMYKKA